MRRRRLATAAAAAAVAALLAGCGGGGDADSADATAATATPALPTASGASAAAGAGEALAALGSTDAVDPDDAASTLGAYESFGLPHDLFRPQVTPAEPPAADQATAATATAPLAPGGAAVVPVPLVPGTAPATVPLTGAVAPTAPPAAIPPAATTPAPAAAPAPDTSPSAGGEGAQSGLTAYLQLRDVPVTAQQGDTIPPDRQELVVSRVAADGVTLTLVRGLLPNGSDTLELAIGETAKLIDTQNGQGYTIKLTDVREAQTP